MMFQFSFILLPSRIIAGNITSYPCCTFDAKYNYMCNIQVIPQRACVYVKQMLYLQYFWHARRVNETLLASEYLYGATMKVYIAWNCTFLKYSVWSLKPIMGGGGLEAQRLTPTHNSIRSDYEFYQMGIIHLLNFCLILINLKSA